MRAAPRRVQRRTDIASDGKYVYFACGDVFRVAESGGASTVVAPNANAQAVALDDAFVYWASSDGVSRAPKKP